MIIYDVIDDFKRVDSFELGEGSYWIMLKDYEIQKFETIFSSISIAECKGEDSNQIPKIDFYTNYFFMTINELEEVDREIYAKGINIYLGENFIIIVYKDKILALNNLIEDIKNDRNCLILKDKKKVGIILYYLLDRIIINNYNIISRLESEADKIELNVLKSPKSSQINDLVKIRRAAYKLRKFLNPLRYIGDCLITNENKIIDTKTMSLFKNFNYKTEKLMIALDNLNGDLAMVREAYEAEISNKTNELMKAFTIITAIFLPLELITAIFSLNFDYMPFKNCKYSFYGLMAVLGFIIAGMLIYFKKKKML